MDHKGVPWMVSPRWPGWLCHNCQECVGSPQQSKNNTHIIWHFHWCFKFFQNVSEFFYSLSADVLSIRANAKIPQHSSILTVAKLTVISVDKTKHSFLLSHWCSTTVFLETNPLNVYDSLVQPHFDYCNEVWRNCNKGISNKLQKLQNRAARILMSTGYDSNLDNWFQALGWWKLCHQRLDKKSIMMFKTVNGMTQNI